MDHTKLVMIVWADAYGHEPHTDWFSREDVTEEEYILWDVGFVVKEDANKITIATEFDTWSQLFRELTSIPKENIRELVELDYGRKSAFAKKYYSDRGEEGTYTFNNNSAANRGRVAKTQTSSGRVATKSRLTSSAKSKKAKSGVRKKR